MGRHGKKGIFKDPSVTPGTRTLRLLLSRPSVGILGSALAARWLTPHLRTTLPAPPRPWHLTLGAATVGLGVGYGAMATLQWTRRRLIGALLAYKGWLFNQKSKSTMLWGVLLKLLVGPGPHSLHDFDDVMPKLPVPSLDETCRRYLLSVKPLLTPEEYAVTETLVEELQRNDGPKLQEYLLKRAKTTPNWLAEWWLTNAYLARRDPIALNVNFFMMGGILPEVSTNPLARAANIIHDTLQYNQMVKDGSLPPDMVMDMIPTCMEGVRFMCASTRIPGEHCDSLKMFPNSSHIVIVCKGIYFTLEMYPKNSKGKRQQLNKHEIKQQLAVIWQLTRVLDNETHPISSLTTQNRTKWAKDRVQLMQDNADTLEAIESAIFIVSLPEDKPESISAMSGRCLAGKGADRWFDKSLVLEVWADCAMGGGNMEHSGSDATHFAVMWEHVLQLEEYGPDGDLRRLQKGQTVRTELPPPHMLHWNLKPEMKNTIQTAYDDFMNTSDKMDILIHHSEFGRRWMKSRKVSPDGFIQMAIQLAFWRMHGCFTKTYEPASHRLFALGRTDNINPVSAESVSFVAAMEDPSVPTDQRVSALKAAIDFQNRVRLEATAGFGCDRHMLGLECAARELGMDVPAVFNDKAYKLPMRLSTSQVPTTIGHLGLDLIPETIAGGFGPVCEGGYGVLYCSVGDDMFNFSISSWRGTSETDSVRFAETMRLAMRELKDLLDGKQAAPAKGKEGAPGKL